MQCITILPEVTKKIEDAVKHSRSKRTKQRRAKCHRKLDEVAILDYRRYRRRLISHQTSRKICTSGDLEARDVARAWERHAKAHATSRPHQYSSAFLTSSRGVSSSSSTSLSQLVGFRWGTLAGCSIFNADIPSSSKLFAIVFLGLIGFILRLVPLHLQTLISSLIHTHTLTHNHTKSLEVHSHKYIHTNQALKFTMQPSS